MSKAYGFLFALGLGASTAICASAPISAQAQTAADLQRLNQAMASVAISFMEPSKVDEGLCILK